MSSPNEQEQHTNGIWWEDPNKAKEKEKVNKNGDTFTFSGAVYNWLSKLMTRLRLLCFAIVLKVLYQLFKYWEPKPIASCTWDFSGTLSKLQVISRNSFWFNALLAEDKITDVTYINYSHILDLDLPLSQAPSDSQVYRSILPILLSYAY